MKLIKSEIKKLVFNKSLYFFLAICLTLNLALIAVTGGERSYIKYIGEITANAGDRINRSFLNYVSALPDSEFIDRLTAACAGAGKIFDSFDAAALGRNWYYDEYYIKSSFLHRMLYEKYEKLNNSVKLLNSENADLSVYGADATGNFHEALFTYTLKALMIEGFILISLLTIHIMGIERQSLTESIIYSSRRGRALVKDKMCAAWIVNTGCILLLYGSTLAFFFSVWDIGGLWEANVSSCFHLVTDVDLPFLKPFLTWTSFTVREYFTATLLLEAALLLVWQLISSCIGILCGSSAKGFLTAAACLTGPYFLPFVFKSLSCGWSFYINTFSISMLTLNQHLWFTDMGVYELLPWQETLSAGIHLSVCVPLFFTAIKIFKRRELM